MGNYFTYKNHGNHVFADYTWDTNKELIDDKILAETIFQIMQDAIANTSMTIVHKKLCILGNTPESPPGFTSIILIDESHCSSHCYSDRGWLAVDTFTCGKTDPVPIMEYIKENIKQQYPSLKCTYFQRHKRFHY
jgi:S-adenosylmethionine decarboxylase